MINDGINDIPDNKIAVIVYGKEKTFPSLISLKTELKREWFSDLFYFCLPITFANQYGFGIKALFDFDVIWDGGNNNDSVKIISDSIIDDGTYKTENGVYGNEKQKVASFFGNGTFSIFHDFILRTPKNTNLLFTQAPNYFIPGVSPMTAVIETDNLVRDFAMTFKITVPNLKISIKKGDLLASILPIPRYFVDSFELENAENIFSIDILGSSIKDAHEHERVARNLYETKGFFGKTEKHDKKELGIYYKGIDPYGNKFKSHQRKPLSDNK